ncbi:MAG: transcriptional regulator TrmB [Candidatus Peregrinibacteria bacterium GW2011_GWC2_39_14]|nr:MAG: Transcriptional regulator, TrmB [Candidatus Peregrinibacteria bacterium GW2011_GWA2_38_36]KKR06905.1 MAG: transcriptional regulator TrmB [Candidatus Peregrinibacteria bacterium GW2011_GWC2_39_14]
MLQDNLQHILQEIGFTEKEAVIYLTNLKIGTNRASVIANESNTQRSTAYSIIEVLKRKGFLMELKKDNLKLYTATDPKIILNHLKYKQLDFGSKIAYLSENISVFNNLKTKYHIAPQINLITGENGIIYAYESMLMEKSPIKSILSSEPPTPKIKQYLEEYNKKRIAKEIPLKIMTCEKNVDEMRHFFVSELCEIKFIGKNFMPNSTINIYGDKMSIISHKSESVILIDNKLAVETFSKFFDITWNEFSLFCRSGKNNIISSGSSATHH